MIDGIPIWQYLKNGIVEKEFQLISNDYGAFAEILGKRILRILTAKERIFDKMFPDICILSVQTVPRVRIEKSSKYDIGDLAFEISYKKDDRFGKKIVIFEIKHGKFVIEQNQFRRYCAMIDDPDSYLPKADEVKVIYVMFDKLDTMNCSAYYSMRELDRDFAHKILENPPVDQ